VSIESAQERLTAQVMAIPGVVGIGLGECDGEPCFRVMVVEKTEELVARVPERFESYKVVIDETGEMRARTPPR